MCHVHFGVRFVMANALNNHLYTDKSQNPEGNPIGEPIQILDDHFAAQPAHEWHEGLKKAETKGEEDHVFWL